MSCMTVVRSGLEGMKMPLVLQTNLFVVVLMKFALRGFSCLPTCCLMVRCKIAIKTGLQMLWN